MEETETQPEEIIEEQPKTGFLEKLKPHKFKILAGVLGILVFTGAVFGAYKFGQMRQRIKPEKLTGCTQDTDCILAIRLDQCCSCPEAVSREALEKEPNLVEYIEGKDYSQEKTVNCEGIVCEPCGPPPYTTICSEGKCQIEYQAVSDETANWRTYTNTKYGFEFKYPPNLKQFEWPDAVITLVTSDYEIEMEPGPMSGAILKGARFQLEVSPPTKEDFVTRRCEYLRIGSPNLECKQVTFFNFLAAEVIDRVDEEIREKTFFVEKEKKVYRFSANIAYPLSERQGFFSTFDLVLSTFKFLEETEGWKTYTNTQVGFSIKYPPDWEVSTDHPEGALVIRRYLTTREIIGVSPAEGYSPLVDWIKKNFPQEYSRRFRESEFQGMEAITDDEGSIYVLLPNGEIFTAGYLKDCNQDWAQCVGGKSEVFDQMLSTFRFLE